MPTITEGIYKSVIASAHPECRDEKCQAFGLVKVVTKQADEIAALSAALKLVDQNAELTAFEAGIVHAALNRK